mgnify:CR=1 FL=1
MKTQFLKKKFSYKDILYKGKRLGALCLILVFGAGLVVTSQMGNEIPVHDGDVLVDSLAVSEDAPKEGTFEEMRAAVDLDMNKLLSSMDSEQEKKRITGYMEKELAVESLIKSKNLPSSYVVITEGSVSVTVDKQELDTNTVAKICDIVMRETGRTADKIVIQSKY